MNARIFLIFAVFGLTMAGFSQGSFQNLNFEEANPVAAGNGYYSTASSLPGWQVFYGTTPISTIPVVTYPGGGDLSLTSAQLVTGASAIDGSDSVCLLGGVVENFGPGGSSLTPEAASISQTGLIPSGSQSLLFKAASFGNGPLTVDIGGQSISFAALGGGPSYTLYGANISAWAGQTETLTFSASPGVPSISNWELDDISFSPNSVVPEPNLLGLTAVGGIIFALNRRFGPRRR